MSTRSGPAWTEYAAEAAGLGIFMLSACLFTALLESPASPARAALPDPFVRRALVGIAMGLTAIGLIYSPWGRRSGAHLNPSVTLTFLRLGKMESRDALFYLLAQFAGGVAGVAISAAILGPVLAESEVRYAVTVPGPAGTAVAFAAEVAIAFGLMLAVLVATNTPVLARATGLIAGCLVAAYITFEGPLSGMSMNPARTLASAIPAHDWTALWVYFTAPPIGMLLAAETWLRVTGRRAVKCAKLDHPRSGRCIFRCGETHEAPRIGVVRSEIGGNTGVGEGAGIRGH